MVQYKQGEGKTKGLGRLSGRSGLARLWRAQGSDWEPTAGMGQGNAARQRGELCMAVPKGAQSRLRLKQLDCAGQRERDVTRGGLGGFVLPARTVVGKPKPALTVSLSPASSLLFFFPFKGETGKEEDYCEIKRNVVERQTPVRNRS